MVGMGSVVRVAALVTVLVAPAACCCDPKRPPCPPERGLAAPERAPIDVAIGTLDLSSEPAADAWIDGVPRGSTPLRVPLPIGSHEIVVRLGGFEEHVANVDVAPGAVVALPVRLVARDVEDREVLQALARPFGMWVQPFEEPAVSRGEAAAPPVRVLYPRGPVRAEDLRTYRLEFSGAPGPGRVEFRRGNDLIAREDLAPPAGGGLTRAVPDAVRKALAAGDRVSWGFFPAQDATASASAEFEIVKKEVQPILDSMAAGLAGQPEAAKAHLKAQALLDAGLFYGAHEEAMRLVEGGQQSARAWAVVLESLEKMGASKDSAEWKEAQAKVGALSPAAKKETYSTGAYGAQKLLEHLSAGQAARALQTLDEPRRAALAGDPTLARDAARAAAVHARDLAAKSPGSAKKAVEAIVAAAAKARETAPDSPDAAWAVAESLVAKGRVSLWLGEKPGPESWSTAADALVEVAERGGDEGEAFARAVGILHEAARLPWADSVALRGQAAELCDRASLRFPQSAPVAVAVASNRLERTAALPEKARKEARALLASCFEALQPHLATETPDLVVATLHEAAVSLDRSKKLGLNSDYRTTTHFSAQNLLRIDLPVSLRWQEAPDLLGKNLLFVREAADDGRLLRVVTVRSYDWGVTYRYPGGREASGENIGLVSKADGEETRRGFQRARDVVKSRRDSFSRRFDHSYAYELVGTDRDGGFRRLKSHVFRSEAHKVSYNVTIEEFEDGLGEDPALRFVLESLDDAK